jgi:Ca-activated chloride channel family protein
VFRVHPRTSRPLERVRFGIGSGVNRYLIEGIARAGLGDRSSCSARARRVQTAERFRSYIESPALTT